MIGALRHRPRRNPGRWPSIPRRTVKLRPTMSMALTAHFARAFVAELKVPGREVRRLFDNVRDDVCGDSARRCQAAINELMPLTYPAAATAVRWLKNSALLETVVD